MEQPQRPAPQLTVRAIVLAIVLATVLAAANSYLGLFAGLTLASGVIFTIPALVILGYWKDFDFGWTLAIAGLGGLLGVLFSVPLRRSLIVDQDLAFPEGKAAAEVLKAGENPAQGIRILGSAALAGGLAKFAASSGLRLIPDTAVFSGYLGKFILYVGTNLSGALLGVGYIVGLNIGIVVVAGSVVSWNVVIPIYSAFFLNDNTDLAHAIAGADAAGAAYVIWGKHIRYLGVGAMLVGGIWTLIKLRSSLLSGIRNGLAISKSGSGPV